MFKRDDWIFGLVALGVGVFVLLYSNTIDNVTAMDPSGPAAMPRILAWMMTFIGAAHLVGAYFAAKKDPKPEQEKKEDNIARVVLVCVVCFVYLFLFETIGYLIMAPLLMVAIMTSFGDRKISRILGMSIGLPVFLFCVFRYLLGVNIPLGILSGFLR